MNTPIPSRPLTAAILPRAVVLGGLMAGTLDLVYAFAFWGLRGVEPVRILHSIASGWLGPSRAMAGGAASAWLGGISHYAIALAMAWTYYLIAKRRPALVRHPWRHGALYGVVLYAAMTYVVVPLSAAHSGPLPAWRWLDLAHVAAHAWLVGVPCALAARRALAGTHSGK
ncbi:hypothetical protein [Pseudoxanthomonas putridarboris]|uniref:DUF1440 domain-containing protein n=1 Tax=Pseudoxanthomonas putridarboris TaxID=752605 RepID=A0ABU9J4L2_9GAMM